MKEWRDTLLDAPPQTPKKIKQQNRIKTSLIVEEQDVDEFQLLKEASREKEQERREKKEREKRERAKARKGMDGKSGSGGSGSGKRERREGGRGWKQEGWEVEEEGVVECGCESPLKWSPTIKSLHHFSLLLTLATSSMLKSLLLTTNAPIATEFSVSYTSAVALTGVPLIFGAFAGLGARMLAKVVGKRALMVGGSLVMLVGGLWGMHVVESYASFMGSRVFQGVGWGVFEGLVAESISDVFLPSERAMRMNINTLTTYIFLLGTPILGGYLSQSTEGFRAQLTPITILQAFGVLLLILCAPETTYHHSHPLTNLNPASTFNVTTTTTVTVPPYSGQMKTYLKTLRLSNENSTQKFSVNKMVQPLKALAAPSAILTALLTAPLLGTAWGISQTLSLLLTSMPTFLFPSRMGYIFILPLVFTLILFPLAVTIQHFISKRKISNSPENGTVRGGMMIPGMLIAVVGLITFGIYVSETLSPDTDTSSSSLVFTVDIQPISLKIVSALLGVLISGSVVLETAADSLKRVLRESHATLQEVLVGIWVIGMPCWIGNMGVGEEMVGEELKITSVVLAVVGIVVGSSVGAVLVCKGAEIGKLDQRVLGKKEEKREFEMGKSFLDV